MKDVRIAIVGSRTFNDYQKLKETVDTRCIIEGLNPVAVVSGGAKGADLLGARYAEEKGIPLIEYKPDWKKYGRSAGFKRNVQIIDDCDVCFAFWDGQSKGTLHDIKLCEEKGKVCYTILFEIV